MATRNRSDLTAEEKTRIDAIEAEYNKTRRDAFAAYRRIAAIAADRRADRLFALIDSGPRSTQARVTEYLGLRRNTLTDLRRRWRKRSEEITPAQCDDPKRDRTR